jgi:hypothetical protein
VKDDAGAMMTKPILDCPTPIEFTGEELATVLSALSVYQEETALRGIEFTAFFGWHKFFRPVGKQKTIKLVKRLREELETMQEEQA